MSKSNSSCVFCGREVASVYRLLVVDKNAICDRCVKSLYKQLATPANENVKQPSIPVLSQSLNPHTLRAYLDQYVIGQDEAKKALSVAVVNHYKRLKDAATDVSKSNLLIAGPSGSGKTLLVSTIAKCLNVPFISIDATSLTEAGFVGQNIDTVLTRLVVKAGNDLERAATGIIFIDEVDKISSTNRPQSTTGKVTGIQSGLLRLIEGCKAMVPMGNKGRETYVELDTSKIMFIAGGAFFGMETIIKERKKTKQLMGFDSVGTAGNVMSEMTTDDFIEYGMLPEFIGRFSMKTFTQDLTEAELSTVLSTAKNNVLDDFKYYFKMDKIELEFTADFIESMSSLATKEKTGVRGLRTMCERLLTPHLYDIPLYQKESASKIIFDRSCAMNQGKPTIIKKLSTKNKKVLDKN